ncbi:hypothetical protein Nepgr_019688 [Nepenthes gracilis]|uniref:Uncharacterized protein n=1 Tax=Nepenthes gracilis TaxID=150966 RepID=A0AAD3XUC9_NEPGR|nr:hypothetical protein Nepgr_019688 [Nepenthes gracilis]
MALMVEEFIASSRKREYRFSRARNLKEGRRYLMESIAQVNGCGGGGGIVANSTGEHGAVRMKIVVRKQDLKQILEAVRNCVSSSPSSLSLDQRLFLMRRRIAGGKDNQGKGSRRSSWRPALQSIPEEH